MSLDTVTPNHGNWALFLDVDGTLLNDAETPRDVHVSERVKQLLLGLTMRLDGALALISGRSLDEIDRLFAPLRFCASGVHGCELREASGCVVRAPLPTDSLCAIRVELESMLLRNEELLFEDKRYGLAVHFGRAPHLHDEVHNAMENACQQLGSQFRVRSEKCVLEISPAAWSNGTAIAGFMGQMPFANRMPIYIGDDETEDYGFQVVNELGGVSIKVGDSPTTLARHRLPGERNVIHWLESLPPPFLGYA